MAEESSAIAISAGYFEAFDDRVSEAGIEYRFAPLESYYDLIPVVGAAANNDDSYWLCSGVRYDFNFSSHWLLTPNIAVTYYEQNDGKDLGSSFQVRTGIDLAYQVSDSSRISLGVYHLSNASTSDENPGADSLIFTYSRSL